jgi:hypothetical protein
MRKWLPIAAALIIVGLLLALVLSTKKPAPITINFLSTSLQGEVTTFTVSNCMGRVLTPKAMEKWNGSGWVQVPMGLENWFQTANPELLNCRFGNLPAGRFRFAAYANRYVRGWRSLGVRIRLWLQDKRTSLDPFDQQAVELGNPEVIETEFSVP